MIDSNTNRTDSNIVLLKRSNFVSIVIEINIDWDTDLYHKPVFHSDIKIFGIVIINNNDYFGQWLFNWCISPALVDGTKCVQTEAKDSLESSLTINALNTVPGYRYVSF